MFNQRFRRSAVMLLGLVGLALLVLWLPGCGSRDQVWPKNHPGPKVVVSFAPLYCFAINVAGDDAVVRNMMTTSGPHEFNPTDRDARLLQHADLFFINGIGLEGDKPESLARSSGNRNLRIVNLGDRIPAEKLTEGSCHHDHGDSAAHEHGKDPHVWLSPDYAILQVEGIRDALKEADPAHAAGYDQRAAAYIQKLEKLKADGLALFKDKKDRKLVTFHDSMSYFARTFDLNIVGVVQKNPGTEPNDAQLRELINLCADERYPVRIITVEPQYGASIAGNVIRKALIRKKVPDPELVQFDTLETTTPEQLNENADWYEARMRTNLEALAKAMK